MATNAEIRNLRKVRDALAPISVTIADYFGTRMRAERLLKNITRSQLAEYISCSKLYIYYLESKTKGCSLRTAYLIASVLGVTLDSMLPPVNGKIVARKRPKIRRRSKRVIAENIRSRSARKRELIALVK